MLSSSEARATGADACRAQTDAAPSPALPSQGYKFGAKLVRGAYMVVERKRAKKLGVPSPIHDTLDDTHASYNKCVFVCVCVRVGVGK